MTYADDVRTVDDPDGTETELARADCGVTAHECSPRRTVFTEKDNSDGWIATDTTVDLLR